MRLVIYLSLLLFASQTFAQLPTSVRGMEGSLLKGDGVAAKAFISESRKEQLSEKFQGYVSCVEERLDKPISIDEKLPAFTSKVLSVYQAYWQKSLLNPTSRTENELALKATLADLLGQPKDADFSSLEDKLQQRFTADGFFSLMGFTPPMHELMLWRVQNTKLFRVALPEQSYESKVVMLDKFVSLGWTGWATCDNRSTGGWATESTLYSVMSRYTGGVNSNAFLAVLLTHETQHFADKNTFPNLKPWELEFRAKLAELWAADSTTANDRLGKFVDSQSDDQSLAHPYANAKVLSKLTTLLKTSPLSVDNSALRNAAKTLLSEDTAARLNSGVKNQTKSTKSKKTQNKSKP